MKLRSFIIPAVLLMCMFTCQTLHAAPHSVSVTWKAPIAQNGITVTGYKLYRGTATGAEGATAYATVTGGTTLTFTDSTVTGGTTYFYKVTATATCDSAVWDCTAFSGESVPSNEAVTDKPIPRDLAPAIGAPSSAAATVSQ